MDKKHFESLSSEGYFNNDDSSKIALLALYMPWLRVTIGGFVNMWNSHKIRKQPKRPYAMVGKPYMLHNYPEDDVIDYGVPVDMASLNAVEADIQHYGKIHASPDHQQLIGPRSRRIPASGDLRLVPTDPRCVGH